MEALIEMCRAIAQIMPVQVRLRLVACTGFILAVFGYALALGVTPWFPGFAHTDALNDVRAELDEDTILSLRAQECHLPSGAAKQFYTATITRRMDEYQRLMGHAFTLAECTDE